MTIHVINPNSSVAVTAGLDAAIDAMRRLSPVPIECHTLAEGPPGIETQAHVDGVVQPLLSRAAGLEAGASGFVIACFSDPGLSALREQSERPVTGIAEAAILTAMQRGRRFGIFSILPASIPRHMRMLAAMGVRDHCAADLPLELGVAELRDEGQTMTRLTEVGADLMAAGSEVLILGCAGMACYRKRLEETIGCPVIDPCQAAVAMTIGKLALSRAEGEGG